MTNLKTISFERALTITPETPSLRSYITGKKRYFFLKRVSDIIIASLVTIVLVTVLLPIIALLIKLESRGPVFFVQRRVGRGGKSFRCYKFRTMVMNDDANTLQASEDDARITRVGKFLRNCNLDEFPQFINVLLGDMSIVGPRPHMHSDCAKFSAVIPGYKFRNIVRPGITGLAQSKGYRGPTHDFSSMFHRYQFDAFYVRNANFWLDMRIIRRTAAQTFENLFRSANAMLTGSPVAYKRWVAVFIGFFISK